jgi:hypothetical protein
MFSTSAALTFTAHYHFRRHSYVVIFLAILYFEHRWPHVSGSGDIDGQTSGDVIQVAFAIDAVNGKPSFRLTGINVQIQQFKLHFKHSPVGTFVLYHIYHHQSLVDKSTRRIVQEEHARYCTKECFSSINEFHQHQDE